MPLKKNIRIIQLIDSLEPGGAERMAVSYANALQKRMHFSGIVVTRKEGNLQAQLDKKISYLFLNRKQIVDIKALWKFRKYLLKNNVTHVQAHSTSIYFAFLLKILLPSIRIIWHDHYGKSEMLVNRKKFFLSFISVFMYGIISVNKKLQEWSIHNLFCNKVKYLANFTVQTDQIDLSKTTLMGEAGKRIICLANLRPQKNHFLLLDVASKCKDKYPDWTFHLVGKDFNDFYSKKIRSVIQEKGLVNHVFMYGSCDDVTSILKQGQIGVLTSDSEGLPVALLEYGLQKLAVISTAVGEIPTVIENKKNGILVKCKDDLLFANFLFELIENSTYRDSIGCELEKTILKLYSEDTVLNNYLNWINEK